MGAERRLPALGATPSAAIERCRTGGPRSLQAPHHNAELLILRPTTAAAEFDDVELLGQGADLMDVNKVRSQPRDTSPARRPSPQAYASAYGSRMVEVRFGGVRRLCGIRAADTGRSRSLTRMVTLIESSRRGSEASAAGQRGIARSRPLRREGAVPVSGGHRRGGRDVGDYAQATSV